MRSDGGGLPRAGEGRGEMLRWGRSLMVTVTVYSIVALRDCGQWKKNFTVAYKP